MGTYADHHEGTRSGPTVAPESRPPLTLLWWTGQGDPHPVMVGLGLRLREHRAVSLVYFERGDDLWLGERELVVLCHSGPITASLMAAMEVPSHAPGWLGTVRVDHGPTAARAALALRLWNAPCEG